VTDIAEQADVDPSTFFRHFGSKEAVLFTDVVDFLGHVRQGLLNRPARESLLDTLAAATLDNSRSMNFDPEQEALRAQLTESTPAIHAQVLVYREELVNELASAIGERQQVDPATDVRPYLAATTWVAAFTWYGSNSMLTGRLPASAQRAVDEIVELLRPNWHVFNDGAPVQTASSSGSKKKPAAKTSASNPAPATKAPKATPKATTAQATRALARSSASKSK
jgi:AcrR family transcriptional regulator